MNSITVKLVGMLKEYLNQKLKEVEGEIKIETRKVKGGSFSLFEEACLYGHIDLMLKKQQNLLSFKSYHYHLMESVPTLKAEQLILKYYMNLVIREELEFNNEHPLLEYLPFHKLLLSFYNNQGNQRKYNEILKYIKLKKQLTSW